MNNNIIGTILSIGFVVLVIAASEGLKKGVKLNNEATRKFIHIGVSHWWLVAMILISDIKYAVIPPILFIFLNYLSYKKSLIKSMERDGNKEDLGTVYFPISLLVLILLTWDGGLLTNSSKYIGAIGILSMGYGDGFAAIIGKKYGQRFYSVMGNKKTIEGSITMFIFSVIVSTLILTPIMEYGNDVIIIALCLGLIATLLEAFTPFGLDNLTVPILVSLCAYFFLNIAESSNLIELLGRATLGVLINGIIAYGAYSKNSLSLSGAFGAILLGTGIFVTGGFFAFVLMMLFFVSSSALSHYKKSLKRNVEKQFDKTGKRDIVQVFANGGVALIYSIIYYINNNPFVLILIGISFAAANADTWSTEIGVLNKTRPICLRTFKKADKGTSGAVSTLGTIAGLLGSAFIAGATVLIMGVLDINIPLVSNTLIFTLITIGGFIGGIVDSLLGATLQGIYYSDDLKKETEKKYYQGKPTRLIRGFGFLNNDLVNFISIGLATVIFISIL